MQLLLTALRSRILRDIQLEDSEFNAKRDEEQKMIDVMGSALESLSGEIAGIVTENLGHVDAHFDKYQNTIRDLWRPLRKEFKEALRLTIFPDNGEVSPSV